MDNPTENSLTIDVEDWYHVCGLPEEPVVGRDAWRVLANIEKLLLLLDDCRTRATFFVLGAVAAGIPELVPLIAGAGHEIASHGWSHRLVDRLGPAAFREEIRRTGELLDRQGGSRPVGFRAPSWSLSTATPWAFETLVEEGYVYDSSCSPLPFVGDPTGPRTPFRRSVGGRQLWEIPPMVTPSPFGNLPTGGGWGFRFFPLRLLDATMKSLNESGAPAVIFIHPREVDPEGPRLTLPMLKGFAAYGTRCDAAPRLRALLTRFRFTTLRQLVETWDTV